jgi:hypothetical protein
MEIGGRLTAIDTIGKAGEDVTTSVLSYIFALGEDVVVLVAMEGRVMS